MKYNILIVLVIFALSFLQIAASEDCTWKDTWYQASWGCITISGTGADYTGGAGGTFSDLKREDPENPCILIGKWHENNGKGGKIRLTKTDADHFEINFDHSDDHTQPGSNYDYNGGEAHSVESCP